MTVTGQLWYTTLDIGDGQLAGYLNSDGSSITQVGPTSQAGLNISVDTAAGYYFIVNGDFTSISSYRISGAAAVPPRRHPVQHGLANVANLPAR